MYIARPKTPIDLKKAFDAKNRNILLTKLEKYGFRGKFFDFKKILPILPGQSNPIQK